MVVQFRVPAPSSTALLNLLGVIGVLAVVFAVGALTSWAWGLLTFGVIAVAITVLAQTQMQPEAVRSPRTVADIESARKAKAAA